MRIRAGALLVFALLLFVALGPLVAHHDPYLSNFDLARGPLDTPVGPNGTFWLGADRVYRDVFVRLALGGRFSLAIALTATLISTTLGALVGTVSGYFEGRAVDHVLMRMVDVGLAFPFLLLVMAISAAVDRTSATTILWTLGLTGWLGTARVVRAKALGVRRKDFVLASRALGQYDGTILRLHVLPNVAGTLLVIGTAQIAQMIIAESVLSYLGAGMAPPTPTWGAMLFDGQDQYVSAPWLLAAPAFVIVVAVLGFNLLGEGLRDALDPKRPLARM